MPILAKSAAPAALQRPSLLLERPVPERPAGPSRQPSQAWMTTFTDLVALLITFFVMLFSMSQVEERKWQNLTNSLAENLDLVRDVEVALPSEDLDIDTVQTLKGSDLDYLAALLEERLADEPLLAEARLERQPYRLVVSLPSQLLFSPGAADPSDEGMRAVTVLSALLANVSNRIEVVGHADPQPPVSGFQSNWELSLVRAARVAALMTQADYERPVTVRGFGDSRFESLAPTLPREDREALARRVDIAILEEAGELKR